MAVSPDGLNGVGADVLDSDQLSGFFCERRLRPLVNISHDVHFTFARRAGTMPPQLFKRNERLPAILPFYCQLISNWLDVESAHPQPTSAESRFCDAADSDSPNNSARLKTERTRCPRSSIALRPPSSRSTRATMNAILPPSFSIALIAASVDSP